MNNNNNDYYTFSIINIHISVSKAVITAVAALAPFLPSLHCFQACSLDVIKHVFWQTLGEMPHHHDFTSIGDENCDLKF